LQVLIIRFLEKDAFTHANYTQRIACIFLAGCILQIKGWLKGQESNERQRR